MGNANGNPGTIDCIYYIMYRDKKTTINIPSDLSSFIFRTLLARVIYFFGSRIINFQRSKGAKSLNGLPPGRTSYLQTHGKSRIILTLQTRYFSIVLQLSSSSTIVESRKFSTFSKQSCSSPSHKKSLSPSTIQNAPIGSAASQQMMPVCPLQYLFS